MKLMLTFVLAVPKVERKPASVKKPGGGSKKSSKKGKKKGGTRGSKKKKTGSSGKTKAKSKKGKVGSKKTKASAKESKKSTKGSEKKGKASASKKSKRSSSKGKKEKSKKKTKKNVKASLEEESRFKDDNFVVPRKPFKTFVVSYSLLPAEVLTLKVTYMKTCSLVTYEEVTKVVKNIERPNYNWISFSIFHRVKHDSLPQVLKSHLIKFKWKSSREKSQFEEPLYFYQFINGDAEFPNLVSTKKGQVPEKEEDGNSMWLKSEPNKLVGVTTVIHRETALRVIGKQSLPNDLPEEVTEPVEEVPKNAKKSRKKKKKTAGKKSAGKKSSSKKSSKKKPKEKSAGKKSKKGAKVTGKLVRHKGKGGKRKKGKKKEKKGKKEKTGDDKKAEKILPVVITGNEILFEKRVWVAQGQKVAKQIHFGTVLLSSECALTPMDRCVHKPLIINIRNIKNLPTSVKDELRIEKISLDYSLPPLFGHTSVKTVPMEDLKKVRVSDVKSFFLGADLPNQNVIETLQFKPLVIRVFGIRKVFNEVDMTKGHVFGQCMSDPEFTLRRHEKVDASQLQSLASAKSSDSKKKGKQKKGKNKKDKKKKGKKKKDNKKAKGGSKKSKKKSKRGQGGGEAEEKILLGFVIVEMYDLMKTLYRIDLTAPLISGWENFAESKFQMNLKPYNLMKFHKNNDKTIWGEVAEKDFRDFGTNLKIEIRLAYFYRDNLLIKTLSMAGIMSRIIVIYNRNHLPYTLLTQIFELNNELYKAKFNLPELIFQRYTPEMETTMNSIFEQVRLHKSSLLSESEQEIVSATSQKQSKVTMSNQPVTGFLVNCIDITIFVFEAAADRGVPRIMTDIFELPTSDGRILYDSDLIFNERLYYDFLQFGGIYMSTMGMPLDSIVNNKKYLTKGLMPQPAYKCLQSLHRIAMATNLSRDLFPTPQELLSMDIEFGVPVHMRFHELMKKNEHRIALN